MHHRHTKTRTVKATTLKFTEKYKLYEDKIFEELISSPTGTLYNPTGENTFPLYHILCKPHIPHKLNLI